MPLDESLVRGMDKYATKLFNSKSREQWYVKTDKECVALPTR